MVKQTPHWAVFDSTTVVEDGAVLVGHQLTSPRVLTSRVLLLLSGGSSISLYIALLQQLPKTKTLTKWVIGLCDERFGTPNHSDSNEYALRQSGVIDEFSRRGARFLPMLPTETTTPEQAERWANDHYELLLEGADIAIALAGMGDDGHIFGMLPMRSPEKFAAAFASPALVRYYETDTQVTRNPFHQRLTLTVTALQKLQQIFVFVMGEKKRVALTKLAQGNQQPFAFPAQTLRELQRPVTIITDQQFP